MRKLLLLCALVAVAASTALLASPSLARRGVRPIAPSALQAGEETIAVYADDCRTLKKYFVLGEVVCVRADSFPAPPSVTWNYRRFQWGAPDAYVAQENTISSDPDYQYFKIPTSGQFAQVGRWIVKTMDENADGYAVGSFLVKYPERPFVNLQVGKVGPPMVEVGTKISNTVQIYADGPEDALRITLTEEVPSGMVFLAVRQESGRLFKCDTPAYGGTGRTVCYGEGMLPEEEATFTFVYGVNDRLELGTVLSGATYVDNYTADLVKEDNAVRYETVVGNFDVQEGPPPEDPE